MEQFNKINLKYNQSRKGYSNIPILLLKGHWLQKFGFNIDDKVIIICYEDEIIIRKVNKR